MKKFIIFVLLTSYMASHSETSISLIQTDKKTGIVDYNTVIQRDNRVYAFGAKSSILAGDEGKELQVINFDFDSEYIIKSATLFDNKIYTFGNSDLVIVVEKDEKISNRKLSKSIVVKKSIENSQKLFLLDSNKTLYITNFNNLELEIIEDNVSDISSFGDKLLFIKNNKLFEYEVTTSTKNIKIDLPKVINHLASKGNKIIVYSDSSAIYKYDYTQNTLADISIKPNAYIQTLDITEQGTIIGVSVEDEYRVEGFIGNIDEQKWVYNPSNSNYLEKLIISKNYIYGLIGKKIVNKKISDIIAENTFEIGNTLSYYSSDYSYRNIVKFKNQAVCLRQFYDYNLISKFNDFEDTLFKYKMIRSEQESFNVSVVNLFSDNSFLYSVSDTFHSKQKKRVSILERIESNGQKTKIADLGTLTNGILFLDLRTTENYIAYSLANNIYWSKDKGNSWDSLKVLDTKITTTLKINEDILYFQTKINNSEKFMFSSLNLKTSEVNVFSEIPQFNKLVIDNKNRFIGLNLVKDPNPVSHITDKILYVSNNGIDWDTNSIFKNILFPVDFEEIDSKMFLIFTNRIIELKNNYTTFEDVAIYFEDERIPEHFGTVEDSYFGDFIVYNDSIFCMGKSNPSIATFAKIEFSTTSVNTNITQSNSSVVYPMPALNNVTISLEKNTLSNISLEDIYIYDQFGKSIDKNRNILINQSSIIWDCSNQPRGIYFVKVKVDNKESIFKIVVE